MERPFDYNANPTYVPTKPDLARDTLTRKMGLRVHDLINVERQIHRRDMGRMGRLCRINNYLFRRERRMNGAA